MLDRILKFWSSASAQSDEQIDRSLERLRAKTAVPVFWLFGKTQTGKTSIVRFLTGADDAEIGNGFQPCTRYSRQYQFPTAETPLLSFLDTRGLGEPGYDPSEDVARFDEVAHVVLVTVKALDHAQDETLRHLEKIRCARPSRPVVLVLTCLHEGYPGQQHGPYEALRHRGVEPVELSAGTPPAPEELLRSLAEQRRRYAGLVDHVVPVDLTRPEEGFAEPNYGGDALKEVLLAVLPQAYRQTLLTLDAATRELKDLHARRALPHILGYSALAAAAGAFPIPMVDLLILPSIQSRMVYHLAQLYGQPLSAARFKELAGSLGMGILVRQAARETIKVIPYVGSVAAGALAGASTFALGKAFCYYYSAVHEGHVPKAEDLKRYYEEQLALAQKSWSNPRHQSATGS
jgi:uncharacterized protein (DUF697 family)